MQGERRCTQGEHSGVCRKNSGLHSVRRVNTGVCRVYAGLTLVYAGLTLVNNGQGFIQDFSKREGKSSDAPHLPGNSAYYQCFDC